MAVVFGLAQLRQFQQQRRDAAAVELMRSLQDGEFARAFRLIYTLPGGLGAESLRAWVSAETPRSSWLGSWWEAQSLLCCTDCGPGSRTCVQSRNTDSSGSGSSGWLSVSPTAADRGRPQRTTSPGIGARSVDGARSHITSDGRYWSDKCLQLSDRSSQRPARVKAIPDATPGGAGAAPEPPAALALAFD